MGYQRKEVREMETGEAMGCSRHMWDMGEQERNFLGPDSGCPYCALEKRRSGVNGSGPTGLPTSGGGR